MTGTSAAGKRPKAAKAPKPTERARRKRTGCLTCRDRHISCDEEFIPECGNCRKSNRSCERGTRFSFDHSIDVKQPPYLLPKTQDWAVNFKDESRAIASEYLGGEEKYAPYDEPTAWPTEQRQPEVVVTPQQQQQHHHQRAVNFSGNRRPAQPTHQTYDDVYGQQQMVQQQQQMGQQQHHDLLSSRGENDMYLPAAQQPQALPSQVMQNTTFGNNCTLSALDERYQPRNDGFRGNHSQRSSDLSSITSSLAPIGAGHGHTLQPYNQAMPAGHQLPGGGMEGIVTPPSERPNNEIDYLNDEEEIYYMQVFVSEVAIWMDSFDHQKHFSRIVPFLALKSDMLLNALLSCGILHASLTNKRHDVTKVQIYYDTASSKLLNMMRNPDRNPAECATTAAVLNVYEIMSQSPQARMGHIAGARALLRECNWNAKSTGIGGACFWLNIGMEVLSCLAFNWQTAWDPDQWDLDNGTPSESQMRYVVGGGGEEEAWVHLVFYIVAKVANFRANIPHFKEPSPHDEQVRLQSRFAEWTRLKAMSDRWNDNCPRPMRPFGYRPSKTSLFPDIWLIRRAAVVGRLFYHTAMCLLAQINPLEPRDSEENVEAQLLHAHSVCGIVAHTQDHGVASVAIRSLTIASSVLTNPDEQKEVLSILDRIHKDTGWKLGSVLAELKKAWGWREPGAAGNNQGTGTGTGTGTGVLSGLAMAPLAPPPGQQQGGGAAAQALNPVAPRPINPLLATADFRLEGGPYRTWYRPPNGPSAAVARGLWGP
ncbi:C6 zinc finger domain-containing protein [Coniochaeta sp. 2T2.1]|nr:C6 zinc finger domain-containing protein [Coniochaeta sp. 2T2.1]